MIWMVKILTIRQKSVWGSCWAGSHDGPSGVLGESSELGRQCSHYMAPLWVCLHIDLSKHFRKEQMLGLPSPMGKTAVSGSEMKGSSPAVSLEMPGSSLSNPGQQRHPCSQGLEQTADVAKTHIWMPHLCEGGTVQCLFPSFQPAPPCISPGSYCPAPCAGCDPGKTGQDSWGLLYIVSFTFPGQPHCMAVSS